jgi:hypothetical protein
VSGVVFLFLLLVFWLCRYIPRVFEALLEFASQFIWWFDIGIE